MIVLLILLLVPLIVFRVVGAQFDEHDVRLEGLGVAPCLLLHVGMVAGAHHAAGTHTKVLHHEIAAQQLLQLGRIALRLLHVNARAMGDAVADAGHALGTTRMLGQRLQPIGEVAEHLVMISIAGTETEAVAARGIDVERTMVAGAAHGRVVGNAIGHGRHGAIVVGGKDDGGGRQMAHHRVLTRPFLHQPLVLGSLVAQEVHARATMAVALVHGDDGIEQDAEVGTAVELAVGAHCRRQMSAGRGAHDAHVERVDAPLQGRVAHGAQGLTSVAQRNVAVALGHAIFQHEERNALFVEIRSPVGAFVGHGQVAVAAAGAGDDGPSRGMFGQEGLQGGLAIGRDVQGEVAHGLRRCSCGNQQQQHE